MIGGVLTSVVVPLLVTAARQHRDGGEAYNQRIFTLSVAALGIVTVVATIAAGLLVNLYAGALQGTEHRLMVVFAYFFIPQIFFYGLSSLIAAILNTRNSFAAPMWTPIINNVIVIVVGLLFVVTFGLHRTARGRSRGRGPAPGDRDDAGHRHPDDRFDPRAPQGGLPVAAAIRLPPRGNGRNRPDGDLDAGLRRVHADHVRRHDEAGQHGERAGATTPASPRTTTRTPCFCCRTPSSACR